METATLLSVLRERNVRVWVEGDRLKCSAPAGALDAELRATLADRKQELLAWLRQAEALKSGPAELPADRARGRDKSAPADNFQGGSVADNPGTA
ncbi:hypothetical protein [Bradyrhizobium sp. BR 1433]|uniref:TubC N-terminal docking domain-related protein n=1 Tax=Bradyrhizobium sp. BR 1433 TaxID=3447967 RepID=UPI003EE72B88